MGLAKIWVLCVQIIISVFVDVCGMTLALIQDQSKGTRLNAV